jgi:tRNA-2-methylthio-N6-dimethylallyladenosine synthase
MAPQFGYTTPWSAWAVRRPRTARREQRRADALPRIGRQVRVQTCPGLEIERVQNAKYYLETFGCQMNVLDSQLVDGQLRQLGFERVTDCRQADIILFNTCSVRQHAEDKVLSRLGSLKSLKRRRPHTIIGILGCMAQWEKEALFGKAPHLDLLCGPGELDRLPALLGDVWEGQRRVAALSGNRSQALARAPEYDRLETLQAYVRVQRGCDKFCTYCVVPFTRGPERSRPPEHIVDEVRRLVDQGCRGVTLLGQTVNSYAYAENGAAVRFAGLLERVQAVPGLDRVRFVTSFPADWDDDIFRVMRDFPRIMPYLHIPAQSGSNRVLGLMRRGYTVAEYLRLMDTARQHVPHIGLAGDFIVGFCGETEEDFQASVDLVRRVRYQNIFVFKYSPRPGTVADRRRSDDVPPEVKNRRNNELLAVQSGISLAYKQGLVGQAFEVLVEGFSKVARKLATAEATSPVRGVASAPRGRRGAEAGSPEAASAATIHDPRSTIHHPPSRQLVGRTPTDQIVVFEGGPKLVGALVSVRIEAASALTLFGSVQSVSSPARAL